MASHMCMYERGTVMIENNTSAAVASSKGLGMGRRAFLTVAGTAAAALLSLGLVGGTPALAANASSSASDSAVATSTVSTDSVTLAEDVAAKASPSVGTVQAAVQTDSQSGISMGSCVLIDSDGHVLTNYHVIENGSQVQVTLNNTDYSATVLGSDPTSDLAVLQIEPDENTPEPMEAGSSSDLKLGEWVMTIGAPKGESQSVSQGIVSGLSRTASYDLDNTEAIYTGLIQTDAMINEGSSGGALVNADGQLVGITTLSATTTGDWAGMSYAIPSDYAMSVAQQIINTGVVEHPFLGVSLADVTPYNYQTTGSKAYWGAYVGDVEDGSPADEAGLKEGDVITAVDGNDVTSTDDVIIGIRSHSIGDKITLTIQRNGKEQDVTATLGSDKDNSAQSGSKVSTDDSASNANTNTGNGGVFSFFGKGGSSTGTDEGSDNSGSNQGSGNSGSFSGGNAGSDGSGYGWGWGGSDGSNGSWGYWSNPGYGYGYGSGEGYGNGYGYGYGASGTPTSGTVSNA